ncbi:hypothetical protein [Flagellimonas sp. MMG031]|uniref:DUF4270 domain-containing protein n=1 Tax=Flagellimonas sp. MMG031 TaxID=3158549 RepID=A0AAU7MX12_9FLAO
MINDVELISTNDKDFEFEINPFDYPNGNTKLTVKSEASGKESVKNEEFEIKKLLFRSFGGLSSASTDSYLAINLQSTGELVAFKKIVTYEDPIFFHAEDNFIEENIIVTQYVLGTNSTFHTARMYGHVEPGTELMDTPQVANALGVDLIATNKSSNFDITVEGTINSGLFKSLGRNYSFANSAFPVLGVNYDPGLSSDIFLYYFDQSNEEILNNYRYLSIKDFFDQTIQFDEMSSPEVEDVLTVELPMEVERATIGLFGFANEDEYREDMFRSVFLNDIETAISGFTASYPDLPEYPIMVKSIGLELSNGNTLRFEQRGTPDLTIPNLTVQQNDTEIAITGEYDFSELNMEISHPDPGSNQVFRMIYRNASQNTIDMPFGQLEIPEEIVSFLNQRGLEVGSLNDSGHLELHIYDYENNVFPNDVFHFTLRREYGDMVQWTMPINN